MGARWRDAVIYQVHARGRADGDGDDAGDPIGVRDRLRVIVDHIPAHPRSQKALRGAPDATTWWKVKWQP